MRPFCCMMMSGPAPHPTGTRPLAVCADTKFALGSSPVIVHQHLHRISACARHRNAKAHCTTAERSAEGGGGVERDRQDSALGRRLDSGFVLLQRRAMRRDLGVIQGQFLLDARSSDPPLMGGEVMRSIRGSQLRCRAVSHT